MTPPRKKIPHPLNKPLTCTDTTPTQGVTSLPGPVWSLTTQGHAQGARVTVAAMSSDATPHPTLQHGLLGVLNREWQQLRTAPTPQHWLKQHPALAGCSTLAEVVDICRPPRDVDHDEVLLTLVRLTQSGDRTATRVLTQTMLPKLARLQRTALGRRLSDPDGVVVEAFLIQLTRYPTTRRPHRVAANLALDTLKAMPAAAGADELPTDDIQPVSDSCPAGWRSTEASGPVEQLTISNDATTAIAWGLDARIITRSDAALLARIHLSDDSPTLAEVADELGIAATAARARHSRAVRRLAQAAAHLV